MVAARIAYVTFGVLMLVRIALQVAWTGRTGILRSTGRARAAAILMGLGMAGLITSTRGDPPGPVSEEAGIVLVAVGLAGVFAAQLVMGRAWRIGVDPGERTALITAGPFRWVRNPIYTGMLVFGAGIAILVPAATAIAGWAVLFAGVEFQVRGVEEPHMLRLHRDYADWAARTGRFVPGVGRLVRR